MNEKKNEKTKPECKEENMNLKQIWHNTELGLD